MVLYCNGRKLDVDCGCCIMVCPGEKCRRGQEPGAAQAQEPIREPMTYGDRFRALTDDKLVDLLYDQIRSGSDNIPCGMVCGGECCCTTEADCRAKILAKLQSRYEDAGHEER